VAERLAARPDADEIRRRHAGYYRELAERAAVPLRHADQGEWAGLEAEAGNLGAAVRWYLAHDPGPLPGLFGALLPMWSLNDDFVVEARTWIGQLLPIEGRLDSRARTELLLAAVVTARELDDDAAVAACERLRPLLDTIADSYLHAVADLAIALTLAVTGDMNGALVHIDSSLAQLRGQHEPLWTALALVALASIEAALGRYDDAEGHLREMSDIAERFSNARLIAAARVQLGILALARGRLDEARELLQKALDLSLAIHGTRNVSLSLGAAAQLAFATGNAERSALLAAAAEGVRRRAGLRSWPTINEEEAALTAQLRQALGAERFDTLSADGARLSQREAAAAAKEGIDIR
jgi:tetratricopeptide (TPR) repeat protein